MLQSSVRAPTHYFFFPLQKTKVLILAWWPCIPEQAPVDQVSPEKSGMCASISRLCPNRRLGSGDQHTQNSSPVRMLAWESAARAEPGPSPVGRGLPTHSSACFLTEQVHSLRHQALARTPLSDIRKPSWQLGSCLLPLLMLS